MATLDPADDYGWHALPRSLDQLFDSRPSLAPSTPMKIEDIPLPESPVVEQVMMYAKQHLPPRTFNHSMRVFYYGQAIATQHFPSWTYSNQTLLLAALLHDIGTIPENQFGTHLSFEFQGGFIALELLKSHSCPVPEAELVCETIIRHQDLGDTGKIATLTAIIHFATVLDNAGLYPELVAKETIESVCSAYPRGGWTGCFAKVVREECRRKPWANTTRIDGFAEMVEGNEVMREYD